MGEDTRAFDSFQLMQDFYVSRYFEPNPERPADNIQAAIEFTVDRHLSGIDGLSDAETIGLLSSRILALAPRAGLYVGININPAPEKQP